MAKFEADDAQFGQDVSADVFFDLAMKYASGRDVEQDMISAHKWMNIAATKGNRAAFVRRAEFAEEMSRSEMAAAQRAAREFLQLN